MKKILISGILILLLGMGCSLNDSMTKVYGKAKEAEEKAEKAGIDFNKYYLGVINKIRTTIGEDNIRAILKDVSVGACSEWIIKKYEEKTGEKFSDFNRYIIKEGLNFVLKKVKDDLEAEKELDT